ISIPLLPPMIVKPLTLIPFPLMSSVGLLELPVMVVPPEPTRNTLTLSFLNEHIFVTCRPAYSNGISRVSGVHGVLHGTIRRAANNNAATSRCLNLKQKGEDHREKKQRNQRNARHFDLLA